MENNYYCLCMFHVKIIKFTKKKKSFDQWDRNSKYSMLFIHPYKLSIETSDCSKRNEKRQTFTERRRTVERFPLHSEDTREHLLRSATLGKNLPFSISPKTTPDRSHVVYFFINKLTEAYTQQR